MFQSNMVSMVNTDYLSTPEKNDQINNFQKAINNQSSRNILCSVSKLKNNVKLIPAQK
jgi:hypothetical protein